MRLNSEAKSTVNRTVLNRINRQYLSCAHCRPHRGENASRKLRDDRHKDHRRNAAVTVYDDLWILG